jgi:hypothetical protein
VLDVGVCIMNVYVEYKFGSMIPHNMESHKQFLVHSIGHKIYIILIISFVSSGSY